MISNNTGKQAKKKVPGKWLLSDAELAVVKQIRKKNLSKLIVRFNEEKEISLIEATEKMDTIDVEARYIDHLSKNGYQDVSFTTKAGKVVRFERVTKQKLL